MTAALEVDDVVKTYRARRRPPVRAVDGASFRAEAGAITAVLGRNGAGKTTTLECCAGLRSPDSGRIGVLGRDRADRAQDAWLRQRVGVMVQQGGLPMAPTAGQVLRHVARFHAAPVPLAGLTAALSLDPALATPVRRLSGGQRQRLAVACALVGRPELAFLDEPSSGVDPHARREVWELLRAQRSRGAAVVLTTHHIAEAEELADHVVIMDAGRVVAAGPVRALAAGHTLTLTGLVRPEAAAGAVERLTGVRAVRVGTAVSATVPAARLGTLARLLADLPGEGDAVVSLAPRTLESVFLELTGHGIGEEA